MLTADDARLLRKLIAHRNNLLLAAMEAYQADGDSDELKDTLLRIIKFHQSTEEDDSAADAPSESIERFDHVLAGMVQVEYLSADQARRQGRPTRRISHAYSPHPSGVSRKDCLIL